MGRNYSVIETIKSSDRVNVCLAAADGIEGPVIVKRIKDADVSVYQALRECDNDHIPHIYDIWEDEETDGQKDGSRRDITVVIEYIEGETLDVLLRDNNYSKREMLGYMLQLCDQMTGYDN